MQMPEGRRRDATKLEANRLHLEEPLCICSQAVLGLGPCRENMQQLWKPARAEGDESAPIRLSQSTFLHAAMPPEIQACSEQAC